MDLIKEIISNEIKMNAVKILCPFNKIIPLNIPSEIQKGVIIISNHTIYIDSIIINTYIDSYILCNEENFNFLKILNIFLFNSLNFIKYDGKNGNEVKEKIIEITSLGKNILVFPEGNVSRNTREGIKEFKKGLFYLAYENNIPILPITLDYKFQNSILLNDININFLDKVIPKSFKTFEEFFISVRESMILSLSESNKR